MTQVSADSSFRNSQSFADSPLRDYNPAIVVCNINQYEVKHFSGNGGIQISAQLVFRKPIHNRPSFLKKVGTAQLNRPRILLPSHDFQVQLCIFQSEHLCFLPIVSIIPQSKAAINANSNPMFPLSPVSGFFML